MANKTASVSVSASYTDPDDARAAIARVNLDCPYAAQSHNAVDVVDQDAADTPYEVDFGAIGTEATLVVVRNLTANGTDPGQDMIVKINGSAALYRMPAGGFIAIGHPAAAGATPVASMTLTSTATQNGPGKISTHVFGDPV